MGDPGGLQHCTHQTKVPLLVAHSAPLGRGQRHPRLLCSREEASGGEAGVSKHISELWPEHRGLLRRPHSFLKSPSVAPDRVGQNSDFRKAATAVKKTTRYEESVASRALLEHLRQLRATSAERALEGSPVAAPLVAAAIGHPGAEVSNRCRFDGMSVGVGDLLLTAGEAGFVRACVRSGAEYFLLLELLQLASQGRHSSVWAERPGEPLAVLPLGCREARLAHCWAREGAGRWRALHSAV